MLLDLATEVIIPVCAVIGIAFALVQWVLVSKVKLSADRHSNNGAESKNDYNGYLIGDEEGINDQNVVAKCTEIHNAISAGTKATRAYLIGDEEALVRRSQASFGRIMNLDICALILGFLHEETDGISNEEPELKLQSESEN